ncbi:helix-turn-helix domain-containing protein [Bacillus sp. AFS023182]|uniref:helix-turn-helix domain-containing protein n=1 Tax=Bacillus sp. AFS023182 TaxID=2033492 RepID=UPI001596C528|nr:helix-turn-helix transcriptional regulator [Bacillus sp. AFS023182]
MLISDKLKTLRKDYGYSQEQIANKLHISSQAVSKWETGKSYPDILNLIKLSEIYQITLDELIKEDVHLQKKLSNGESKWKIFGHTLLLILGILLISGNIYLYYQDKINWYSLIVGILFFIDGIIGLFKKK